MCRFTFQLPLAEVFGKIILPPPLNLVGRGVNLAMVSYQRLAMFVMGSCVQLLVHIFIAFKVKLVFVL